MPLFAAEKDSSVDSSKMGPEETAASKPVVPPIPNKDASEKSDAVASAKSGSVVAASTPVIETKEEEPQRLSVFDLEDKKDDDAAKSKAAPSPAPEAPAPAPAPAPKPAPVAAAPAPAPKAAAPAPAPKPAPVVDTPKPAPVAAAPAPAPKPAPVVEAKEEEPQRLSVFDLEDKKDDDAAKSKAAPSPAPKAPAPAPAPKPAPVVDTPAPAPKPAPLADTKEKAPQSNFFDAFKKVERYLPSMSRIVLAFNSLSLSFVCLYRTFSAALQWIPLHPPPRLPRPRPSRRLLL